MEGQEELLVFDFEDLINGIGGALGLFLGWSILYIGKIKGYSSSILFNPNIFSYRVLQNSTSVLSIFIISQKMIHL